jgi:O-methyltransferase/methyltransferase family protein
MDAQPASSSTLLDMVVGMWVSRAICTAAELGLADILKDGPSSSGEIAGRINVSEDALYRLMRALAAIGIFSEGEDRRFSLTALGAYLRSDVAESVRGYSRFIGHDFISQPWLNLLYSVKTGNPAFDHVFGMPAFDHVGTHPEAAKLLNEAMTSLSIVEARAVVTAYDFHSVRTVVDVGGGQGSLLAAILKANSNTRGVLFEMPHALESARRLLEQQGVGSRCDLVGGDFFAEVPKGGDIYIMKRVLHDWDDDRSIRILRNCRQGLSNHGKVLVVDVVVGAPNASVFAKFLDLQMLALTGGRERTAREFAKLYERAGLQLTRIVPTAAAVSIVEGIAA